MSENWQLALNERLSAAITASLHMVAVTNLRSDLPDHVLQAQMDHALAEGLRLPLRYGLLSGDVARLVREVVNDELSAPFDAFGKD